MRGPLVHAIISSGCFCQETFPTHPGGLALERACMQPGFRTTPGALPDEPAGSQAGEHRRCTVSRDAFANRLR